MAKSERRDRLASGPKMDVPSEERTRLRDLREGRGWSQQQLADKIGVSNGTISNLETGGSGQVYKAVYAEVVRVLKAGDEATEADANRFMRAVKRLLELDERGWAIVEAVLDAQPKP